MKIEIRKKKKVAGEERLKCEYGNSNKRKKEKEKAKDY